MWQVRSAQRFSEPVFDPGDRPHEWEILTRLGAMCAGIRDADIDVDAFDDGYFAALRRGQGRGPGRRARAARPGAGPLRLLDLQIRTGPWGDRYGEVPDGLTLQSFRDAPARHRLRTDGAARAARSSRPRTGGIDLAPEIVARRRPPARGARRPRRRRPRCSSSRRHLRSNNSWMHNVTVLVKGKDRCTLLIHPDDADRAGVADGGARPRELGGRQRGDRRSRSATR